MSFILNPSKSRILRAGAGAVAGAGPQKSIELKDVTAVVHVQVMLLDALLAVELVFDEIWRPGPPLSTSLLLSVSSEADTTKFDVDVNAYVAAIPTRKPFACVAIWLLMVVLLVFVFS